MRRTAARCIPKFIVLLYTFALPPLVCADFPFLPGKALAFEMASERAAGGGSMSIWKARKTVINGLQQVDPTATFLRSVPSDIKVTGQAIEFYAAVGNCNLCPLPGTSSGTTHKFDLMRIGTFSVAGSRQAGIGMSRRREPGTGLLINGTEPHYT
ncbi:MAG: hypothetical protein AB1346_13090, partial [Thermodesulfobacteriota bacterium]